MSVTDIATPHHLIFSGAKNIAITLPELVRGQPKKAFNTLCEHCMTGTNISVILFVCLGRRSLMSTLKTCSFDSAGIGGNPAVIRLPSMSSVCLVCVSVSV